MHLLVDEPSLTVSPTLAIQIGINEAMFLQQLYFRLRISKNVRDRHVWVYNTYEQWAEQFPFRSLATVQRVIRKLEVEGYLISTPVYNRMKIDRAKWYRVNYEHDGLVFIQQAQTDSPLCRDASGQSAATNTDCLTEPITE